MIKPQKLNKGDKVAILSLSRGLLGMPFCKHEVDIGIERLKEYGLEPVIMPNSLKDMNYLEEHPEARAEDLKAAFRDKDIKAIICAIGGDDTYKTIPYLMEDDEFKELVRNNPKIFTGYSDTTNNHLMFHKLGLSTFYGPCFLVDIAELDNEMLPYTKKYFEKYFSNDDKLEIESSDFWYNDRASYGPEEVGKPRIVNTEKRGFELLNGSGIARGLLYGGCIESIYDAMTGKKNKDAAEIYRKYEILPNDEEWSRKILFLETSDMKIEPNVLRNILLEFKNRDILNLVNGVILGKPYDEVYYEEYKEVYKDIFSDIDTPVLYNVNFGHSFPRCIIPYGVEAVVDYDNKKIVIEERILN